MPDQEIGRLERAVRTAPGDAGLLLRLALAYERVQRLRDAFRTYDRARALAPDDASVRARWERLGGGREAELCRRLERGVSSAERTRAAAMLDVCGGALARQALARSVAGDPHFAVRQAAAAALGSLADPDATAVLVRALADPHPWVRVRVVEALHRIHDDPRGLGEVSPAASWLEPRIAQWRAWWTAAHREGPG